jgi:hypothetical protein
MRLNNMSDNEKAERLAMEKGRLTELRDPVEITRSHITIARILLDFVSSAVKRRQVEGIDRRLAQYVDAVQAARDAMVRSGRNSRKHEAGYKDLEIATREYTGTLRHIRGSLNGELQTSADNAREKTESINNEMRELLLAKPVER